MVTRKMYAYCKDYFELRFKQDNAGPNTARISMDYIEQNNFNVPPWPSKSSDFSPIAHLWDHLDRRVRQRQPPLQTLDELLQK